MPTPWAKSKAAYARAMKEGYRSGLEKTVASFLTSKGIQYEYEPKHRKIRYVKPAKEHTYLLDFIILNNGIIIETKGRFKPEDREKHILIKQQHPELDIRFVFSNPKAPINKGSNTTCAMWCEKNGFKWAAKQIPEEWLNEPPRGKLLQGETDEPEGTSAKAPAKRKKNHTG